MSTVNERLPLPQTNGTLTILQWASQAAEAFILAKIRIPQGALLGISHWNEADLAGHQTYERFDSECEADTLGGLFGSGGGQRACINPEEERTVG